MLAGYSKPIDNLVRDRMKNALDALEQALISQGLSTTTLHTVLMATIYTILTDAIAGHGLGCRRRLCRHVGRGGVGRMKNISNFRLVDQGHGRHIL